MKEQSPQPITESGAFVESASPHLRRYLTLMRMSREPDRPRERRDVLNKTALDMLGNTTNIEGVSFMPAQEHTKFMDDLTTHGGLVFEEVKRMEVDVYVRNKHGESRTSDIPESVRV